MGKSSSNNIFETAMNDLDKLDVKLANIKKDDVEIRITNKINYDGIEKMIKKLSSRRSSVRSVRKASPKRASPKKVSKRKVSKRKTASPRRVYKRKCDIPIIKVNSTRRISKRKTASPKRTHKRRSSRRMSKRNSSKRTHKRKSSPHVPAPVFTPVVKARKSLFVL